MNKDIHVITGCMFAGKTTELLKRLKKVNKTYLLVKPQIDTRNSSDQLITHSGINAHAITVNKLSDTFGMLSGIELIAIDEAQFFDSSIICDINYLVSKRIQIIIAGLEKDYLNKSFGSMRQIIDMSTSLTRLKAICGQCGKDAYYSHRITTKNKKQVLIGDADQYEALCKICFTKKMES